MSVNTRVIYKTDEGGVAVIVPAVSVELAMKDIPDGVQYKIVDVADIPSDRTFRDAWTVDTTGWETK